MQFIIADVEESIMNFCNIEEVSEGLYMTAYRMAIDLYRNENLGDESNPLGLFHLYRKVIQVQVLGAMLQNLRTAY